MAIGKHLTTKDVADRLGVTIARISQFVSEKRLSVASRVGNIMFFEHDEVERFAKLPRKPGPKKNFKNSQRHGRKSD